MAEAFQPKPLSSIFSNEGPSQDAASLETSTSPEAVPIEAEKSAPEVEAKEAAPEAAQEKPKEEAKADVAEAKQEETKETEKAAPKDQWDTADNPWKKRYEDTAKWAQAQAAQRAALENLAKKQDVIEKKIDGTYDPEKDAIRLVPTPEDAEFQGRFNASLELAVEQHGEETVNQAIKDWTDKFGNNQIALLRVRGAPNPVLEGMKMLNEQSWANKWGGEKPSADSIEKAIRADEAAKWEKNIESIVNKKIEERFKKVSEQPKNLSTVKGASPNQEPKAFTPKPLGGFFPNG